MEIYFKGDTKMEVIKLEKIITDNELAFEKSVNFFKDIKRESLFCKEIIVSSTLENSCDTSFQYENIEITGDDINVYDNRIQIDVEDKFAFFISNNCSNLKFHIDDTRDGTTVIIRYDINKVIKNIISITF